MAFIEGSSPQKITAEIIKRRLFCGAGFNKRREKKIQREKKDDLSLAIGENYIKKYFFSLIFYL
ncbi:unnamed protein product [marine sediment metagenome]|uniref:Uncharacterized protein n=1 Tax=marine sediment metagenome TaxID=412755 RepID=X1FNT8_9ZZZZ